MKKITILGKVFICTFLIVFVNACSDTEESPAEEFSEDVNSEIIDDSEQINDTVPQISLLELISTTQELTLFNDALTQISLEEKLEGSEMVTVFAPTNAAIEDLFNVLGENYSSFEDFNDFVELEILNRLLSYHMVPGNITTDGLAYMKLPTFYENNSIEIELTTSPFIVQDASEIVANPISFDHYASNGTIHIIDKILIPEDLVSFLGYSNPLETNQKSIKELISETEEFEILEQALSITGMLETLDEEGPFTILAPNNEALLELFAVLGSKYVSLEDFKSDDELSLLRAILSYHIIGEQINTSELVNGSLHTLLADSVLEVENESGDISFTDGLPIKAILTIGDIPAANGVIHTIDRMLVPDYILQDLEAIVTLAFEQAMTETGDLDTAIDFFKLVRDRMNLRALADMDFTFFFPSDQAFVDLFNAIGYDELQKFTTDEEGLELVKIILYYHCIENLSLKAEDFKDGQVLTTSQGEGLHIKVNTNLILIDKTGAEAKVTLKNQDIFNGYIHVVDKVLLPQEVLDAL